MEGLFSRKEIETRRAKIFEQMDNFSIMVLFSGVEKLKSADECYPFSVNKNFYYLTQIEQADSVLVLVKTPTEQQTFLFIQPYDEVKEKWTGKLLTPQEASDISYIENVLINSSFEPKLDILIREIEKIHEGVCNLYIDLDSEIKIKPKTTTHEFKTAILNRYDNIMVTNAFDLIVNLRVIKSFEEIERLKEAILYTKCGINKILSELKPNIFEYELVADFEYELRKKYNTSTSFDTIAAAGKNATILHYPTPNAKLNDGDLILFDLGAHYKKYCADISRTFPINGTYNDIQAKLYNEVLKANELVINSVMPGITIAELQQIAIRSLTKSLKDLGLIKEDHEYIKYYFHNVSHHLGLDTHDPSFRERPLVPGNVITVEPGLYIKELGIGIRIEDDLWLQEDGAINLSAQIIKEIDDIENFMANR